MLFFLYLWEGHKMLVKNNVGYLPLFFDITYWQKYSRLLQTAVFLLISVKLYVEDEPNYCGLPRITELYLPILKWIKIFSGHDIEQDAIVGCGGDNCQEEFGKPPTYTKNIVAVMPKSPTGRKSQKQFITPSILPKNELKCLPQGLTLTHAMLFMLFWFLPI